MSDTHTEILGKGCNFIGLLKALDAQHGVAVRERVLELLPQEVASSLRLGMVPCFLCRGVLRVHGRGRKPCFARAAWSESAAEVQT